MKGDKKFSLACGIEDSWWGSKRTGGFSPDSDPSEMENSTLEVSSRTLSADGNILYLYYTMQWPLDTSDCWAPWSVASVPEEWAVDFSSF